MGVRARGAGRVREGGKRRCWAGVGRCSAGRADWAGAGFGLSGRWGELGLALGRTGGKRELGRRGRGWAAHGPRGGKEMGRQVWAAWVGLLRFGPDGSVSTGWAREEGLGWVWVFLFYF